MAETMSDTGGGGAGPALKSQYTRNATGLVREVGLLDQVLFNAASTAPLGAALVVNSFALIVFPQSNLYLALILAIVLGVFVWTTFALLSATMPRVGGDYTYNSRILHPAIALGGNLCEFASASLSTGFWGYWMAVQGFGPVCTVIGSVTNNQTMLNWGNDFSTHKNVIFITATLAVLFISVLSAFGTRMVTRVMTILFLIAAAGFVVSMILLLTKDPSSFKSTVDGVAGHGAYDKTVAAGAKAGLYPDHGYSTKATIGAMFYGISATIWIWWGTYLSAEFRGAGQRARQLKAIVGTGVAQGLLILAGLVILLHAVGYDFFVSALAGNYAGPGAGSVGTAGYAYFSALVASSTPFVVLLAVAFLGWWLPGLYINAAMPQRAILTWAFDSLLPRKLADVDERTHTPIIAIVLMFALGVLGAAWTTYDSSTFFEVYTVLILFAFIPVLTTGVAAMLMKWRRPDLYRGSPAEWRIAGIEVLPIAGFGCLAVGSLGVGLILYFHEQLVPSHFHLVIAGPFITFAIAAVWYYAARAYRRSSDGIDIALTYRVIPPE